MEKYLHRASTAAEEFHAAELEWLQNEALGYSPLLDEVTQAAREDGEVAPSYLMREGTNDSDEIIEVQQVDEDDILRHISSTSDGGGSPPGPSSPNHTAAAAAAASARPISPASLSSSLLSSSSPSDGDKGFSSPASASVGSAGSAGSAGSPPLPPHHHHDDELLMHAKNVTLQEGDHRPGRFDMHRITSIFAAKRRAKYLTRRGRNETVAECSGLQKELHEFKSQLTQDNALAYRKKNVVRAFKTDAPVSFVKAWGVSSGKKGDYVVWNKPGDLYAITAEEFEKNYIPRHHVHSEKSQDDHQFIKKTTVLARRIGYPFKLPHAKLGEISEGMRGDYVIQPENGDVEDQYIVFAETFLERYIIVGSFSEYTEMLKGVIMVTPSKELKRANSSAGAAMHLTSERTKVSSLAFQNDTVLQLLRGTEMLRELDEKTKRLSREKSAGGVLLGGSTLLASGGQGGHAAAPEGGESKAKADAKVSSVAASSARASSRAPGSPRQQDVPEPMGGSPARLGVMSWDFDIFALSHESRHWPLFHLAHHLFFERLDLVTPLGINGDLLSDFFAEIDDTYLPVAYHNSLHGADVLHGCYVMCARTELSRAITKGEHFSFLIAAMCHDLSHPGTNNMFQIDSASRIALKYNDISVLENFHIGTTFEILSKPVYSEMFPKSGGEEDATTGGAGGGGSGRGGGLERLDANVFRKIVIQTILATDLAERERYYRDWDYRVLKKKNLELSTHHADRLLYMKMIIKCSDLKHPSLKRDAHLKWSSMVNEEFIQQAFKEDELGACFVLVYCVLRLAGFGSLTPVAPLPPPTRTHTHTTLTHSPCHRYVVKNKTMPTRTTTTIKIPQAFPTAAPLPASPWPWPSRRPGLFAFSCCPRSGAFASMSAESLLVSS